MLLVDEWLLPLVVEEDMMGARDLDGVVGQSSCDDVDLRDILIPWGRCINRKVETDTGNQRYNSTIGTRYELPALIRATTNIPK